MADAINLALYQGDDYSAVVSVKDAGIFSLSGAVTS